VTPAPWWKGSRGEWYVVAQLALMALVFFGPRRLPGWPAPDFPLPRLCPIVGAGLIASGALLLGAALIRLGPGLTPLPHPKDDATLVQSGPYGLVRHPMYAGGVLVGFGWALCVQSLATLVYAILLLAFLDVKSRREERWLREKFTDYAGYQRRVRKLVPFLY